MGLVSKLFWVLLMSAVAVQVGKFIKGFSDVKSTASITEGLYNNLKAKPIKEFKFFDIEETLGDGWEYATPFAMPELAGYCWCKYREDWGIVQRDSCDAGKVGTSDEKCVEMKGVPAAQLTNWKGKKPALQRFKKKEIEQAHLDQSGKPECSPGFKQCTGYYCVKDYVHCPINKIWLNERKVAHVEETLLVEKIEIGEHELILERGRQEDRIINGLSMELNGMPCYVPWSKHKMIHKGQETRVGKKLAGHGCLKPWMDNLEDHKKVDSMFLQPFMNDNGYSEYSSKWQQMEIDHIRADVMYLTARYKVELSLKKECRNFDHERIHSFNTEVYAIFTIEGVVLACSVLVFVYFMLLSRSDMGSRMMWLGILNGSLNLGAFLMLKTTHGLVRGFISTVNNDLGPNNCFGETKIMKMLVHVTNNVNDFMNGQEMMTRYVFMVCGGLVVFGGITRMIFGKKEADSKVAGAGSDPIQSKKMK